MKPQRRSTSGATGRPGTRILAGVVLSVVLAGALVFAAWWAVRSSPVAMARTVHNGLAATPMEPLAQDATLLTELATRLLTGPDAPRSTIRLLPGQVATEVPLEIAAPPGGRLVGSAVRSADPQGPASVEVVLDAPSTPGEVQHFYEQSFGRQGWSPQATGPGGPPRGFQPTVPPPTFTPFCQGAAGPWLLLSIAPRDNAPTDVRIRVELLAGGPCTNRPAGSARGQESPWAALLPRLYAPNGVSVEGTGDLPGPHRYASDATVTGDVPPGDLEAHFAQQLQAAGWTRREGAAQSALAWSTWTLPGTPDTGELQGFLYALAVPGGVGSGRRALHVEVATANPLAGPDGLGGAGGPVSGHVGGAPAR